jgi:hypothetical protein
MLGNICSALPASGNPTDSDALQPPKFHLRNIFTHWNLFEHEPGNFRRQASYLANDDFFFSVNHGQRTSQRTSTLGVRAAIGGNIYLIQS